MLYSASPNLIIGFHGCDEETRDELLNNPNVIKISKEKYDWLGNGMYFWENNYERALQWAKDKGKRNTIKKPAVIGAVLQLNYCCDFLDSEYINTLKYYYSVMETLYRNAGQPMPTNKDLPSDNHKDKILRELDCSVIEFMHAEIQRQAKEEIQSAGYTAIKIFDSVRGVFTEGGQAFEGSGLFAKSHIQVCVRNLNCIKGFFLPRKEINFFKYLNIVD
jgi:hypothetical protein